MDRGFELTAAAPHSLQWCHVRPTAPHSLQWCHVGPLHHTPCSGALWDPLHHTPCSGAMWNHCTTLPAVVPCGTTAPHSLQWCHVRPTAPHSLQWCHVGPLHHTPCSGAMWDHCTTLPAVVPCGTTAPHSLQWCHVGPTAPHSVHACEQALSCQFTGMFCPLVSCHSQKWPCVLSW